jgi:hypothetical protein
MLLAEHGRHVGPRRLARPDALRGGASVKSLRADSWDQHVPLFLQMPIAHALRASRAGVACAGLKHVLGRHHPLDLGHEILQVEGL